VSARYLIRLDDACDTMARARWSALEGVFDRHGIKPIVAVVPDNRDPTLVFDPPDPRFWDTVRAWQAKGWTIAMHGHTHVMHPTDARQLVPFYRRSEFAGLDVARQAEKIRAAWQLFLAQGVTPQVWVAPAHSFDASTLEAVRAETSIRVVSDGIAWNTFYDRGFHWIPQQLWHFAERRSGLWTVNLHPNQMSDADIALADRNIGGPFRGRFVGVGEVPLHRRRKSLRGWLYHQYFWRRWRTQPGVPQ
jgi:predicted deacetylase